MIKKPYKVPLMKNAFVEEKKTKSALAKFILRANKLSMGEQCEKFERSFASKQGRKDAILFNSGGSANLALIQALKNLGKLKTGDRIGFSALTWSTNVMPIIQLGFVAIPIDCSPKTLNCESTTAIKALKKNGCRAFFITNALGFTGDLDIIARECKKHDIILLEDNCEALGTELYSGKAGNFGLASSFSFFVAHHMSTIEGGMVCTDNFELAEMLKIVRANGWDRNLAPDRQQVWRKKYSVNSDFVSKYTFYDLGFNLRPTEITGFLGLHQLQFLDKNIEARIKNFNLVNEAMKKNNDFIPVEQSHVKNLSPFALPFILKTPKLKKLYVDRFAKAGIEIRPMIAGNIQYQPFYKKYVKGVFSLPGADLLHNNSFYCGCCPDYTKKEVGIILACIRNKQIDTR